MVLAPVIVDRKGEHQHVFSELVANGFIRARVDGIVTDLDHPPTLEKNKKHTIEAVIDRLRVRDDAQQRLAESFETAISLADGVARVSFIDDEGAKELVFSARFACPHCGYSINELEPRMFSFNNPAGACTECDGLGVKQFFDADLVVTDPDLSLAEGAVRGWDRRNVYYFHMLASLAKHYELRRRSAVQYVEEETTRRNPPRERRGADRLFTMSTIAATSSSAATDSKASCRTWSGATEKPIPRWCGKISPAT